MSNEASGIILTIDASDSCSGSGINAAIRTAAALGGYAQTAVTAVSVQTPERVVGIFPVPPRVVADQIRAALSTYKVGAILIGLLPNKEMINAVGDLLDSLKTPPPIIVDPIMASRQGQRFLDKDAIDALKRRILLKADLLMPNVYEAEALTGETIKDDTVMEHAAEMLLTLGPRNVFLKGSVLGIDQIYEIYVDDRRTQVFTRNRIEGKQTHGAGSVLAAAVATLVAQGNTPRQSVTNARGYLENVILNGPDLEKPFE